MKVLGCIPILVDPDWLLQNGIIKTFECHIKTSNYSTTLKPYSLMQLG